MLGWSLTAQPAVEDVTHPFSSPTIPGRVAASVMLLASLFAPSGHAQGPAPSRSGTTAGSGAEPATDSPVDGLAPSWSVFTYPLAGAIVTLVSGVYLPVGAAIAAGAHTELQMEASLLQGEWFACGSESTGGWAALGPSYFVQDSRQGLLVWPKLIARYFTTAGGSAGGFWGGCSTSAAEHVNGDDYELHLGVDLGYRSRIGALIITPLLGVSAGFCGNCVGGGAFFTGNAFAGSPDYGARRNRASLGLNLNLVRVGIAF
jgi:hypothetical protein